MTTVSGLKYNFFFEIPDWFKRGKSTYGLRSLQKICQHFWRHWQQLLNYGNETLPVIPTKQSKINNNHIDFISSFRSDFTTLTIPWIELQVLLLLRKTNLIYPHANGIYLRLITHMCTCWQQSFTAPFQFDKNFVEVCLRKDRHRN